MRAFGPDHTEHIHQLLGRCRFPSPGSAVACAVSGGPDSMALLVLAAEAGCHVQAHHVDHGLRDGSDREADLVADLARRVGAGFSSVRVEVEPGGNLEERARNARYGALPAQVLTGHTADDQAETVLLGLLRGSAWQGLGGMDPTPQRPILGLRRAETRDLCDRLNVATATDPSNADPAHRRNRVRHELVPLLDEIADRDIVPVLVRQAELFRQGGSALDELAADLDPTNARAVAAAPEVIARLAIRRWIWTGRGDPHPPDLATVDRVIAVASLEHLATDVGSGWRVERSAQQLHLVPPPSFPLDRATLP